MNPSREFRCFVRQNILIGEFYSEVLTSQVHEYVRLESSVGRMKTGQRIMSDRTLEAGGWRLIKGIGVSVRDYNYYPHFQDLAVRTRVCETIRSFYEDEIWENYEGGPDCEFAYPSILIPSISTGLSHPSFPPRQFNSISFPL